MKRNIIVSTLLLLSFAANTYAYGCIQDFTQTSVWELHPSQAVGQYISGSHITENTFAGAALLRGDSNPISGTFYIIPGQSNDTSSATFSTSFSSSSQVVYANGTASLTIGNGYTFLWVRDSSGSITEIWQAGDWLSPDSFAYFDTFSDPDNAGQFCFETAPSPSATASPSSSVTPSVTPSSSATPSVTPSISVSPSSSATPSVTPSISVSPSASATPSVTPSISVSPSSSVTPSSSATPSVTPSISVSPSSSATPSVTPSISVSPSSSVTPSSSATPSVTPSISASPSSSVTPSVTPSISVSPSRTPTPSISVSPSRTPSVTPSISASPSPAVNSAPVHTLKSTTYSAVNSTIFNSTQTLIRANTGSVAGYPLSFTVSDPDCSSGGSPLLLYINITTTQTGSGIAILDTGGPLTGLTPSADGTSLTMYGTQSDINTLGQQLKVKWQNNLLSFVIYFSINDNGFSGLCPGSSSTTCALWTASQTSYKTVTVV